MPDDIIFKGAGGGLFCGKNLLLSSGFKSNREELCVNYECNLTYLNNTLITGFSDKSFEDVATRLGLKIKEVKMTEFIKSSCGTRCLTLFI